MYSNQLHPDHQLAEIRARHARLRAEATRARAFRDAKGHNRFRSRHRT